MFDDGTRVMVEDSEYAAAIIDESSSSSSAVPPTQRGSVPLHGYYEIDRMSREVIETLVLSSRDNGDGDRNDDNGAKILRVALQFPDELLDDSPEVCWLLEDKIREDLDALPATTTTTAAAAMTPFCFVLGDTTVNPCCPDEVAALHLNADVLIHYGHACLSPTETLPVLYSFGKLDFDDLEGCVKTLQAARDERTSSDNDNDNDSVTNRYNNNYLLLYQVGYHHAMMDLQDRWKKEDPGLRVVTAQLPATLQPKHREPGVRSVKPTGAARTSCCRQRREPDASPGNGSGGCCGGDSGPPSAIRGPQPDGDHGGASSPPCCGTKADSRCSDAPPPMPPSSQQANVVGEMESDNDDDNDNSRSLDHRDRRPSRRPLVVGGLELPADAISSWEDLSDFTVVFVMGNPEEDADSYSTDDKTTPQQRQYANSMLCFMSLPHGEPRGGFWIYSPRNKSLRTDVSPPPALKRQLKRRFFLTQKARDANVFGILVSNLSQQHLVDVVKSLQRIIRDADRTSYSFAVGKINPAKLANFAEIECFVIVACREHSLLDMEREYPIPVITPMELEIALENLQWGMQSYSLDCQDVMVRLAEEDRKRTDPASVTDDDDDDDNGGGGGGDDDSISVDSDAPYFSMVTGRYESRKHRGSSSRQDLDLAALPGRGQVTEYRSEAANFLKQREYQGLESLLGETEVKAAVPGMRGIASDYRKDANST